MSECDFLHAYYSDNWARCPYPEQVKKYLVTDHDGTVYERHYCDEGAAEVQSDGTPCVLAPLPCGDGEPK